MKKKKRIIVIVILVIALLIPVSFSITDRIRFNNGQYPIFAQYRGAGDDCFIYEGIGYHIIYPCPLTDVSDQTEYSADWRWFWD
jgi:hypothetical protein